MQAKPLAEYLPFDENEKVFSFVQCGTGTKSKVLLAKRHRARRKRAARHGGGQQRLNLQEVDLASPADDDQLLSVSAALDKLAATHAVQAEVVKLRYFVGMTNVEAAQVLGLSERTVKNYWAHARVWLFREINAGRKTG